MWKGLEKKNKSWKADVKSRERDAAQRERQLAIREAELAGKVEAMDLWKKELEGKVEQHLAEAEKKH